MVDIIKMNHISTSDPLYGEWARNWKDINFQRLRLEWLNSGVVLEFNHYKPGLIALTSYLSPGAFEVQTIMRVSDVVFRTNSDGSSTVVKNFSPHFLGQSEYEHSLLECLLCRMVGVRSGWFYGFLHQEAGGSNPVRICGRCKPACISPSFSWSKDRYDWDKQIACWEVMDV